MDFLIEVKSVELSNWSAVSSSGSPAVAVGGPDMDIRVGPGVLKLADGSVLNVAPDTPGGNLCYLLQDGAASEEADPPYSPQGSIHCVVMGSYRAGTSTAEWFSVWDAVLYTDGDGLINLGDLLDVRDGMAVIAARGATVALPVAPDIPNDCNSQSTTPISRWEQVGDLLLPPSDGYAAGVDPSGSMVVEKIYCLSNL